MTNEEIIAVVKAAEEGKQIQQMSKDSKRLEWHDVDNPNWNFYVLDYRVKPEPPKPKYRPYKSEAEAFAEAKKHGFWFKDKNRRYFSIVSIYDGVISSEDYGRKFNNLADFVWADDGTPLGIKEE